MKYSVVQHSDIKSFQKFVNIAIEQGWKLQGGMSIGYNSTGKVLIYCQAMITEDKKVED